MLEHFIRSLIAKFHIAQRENPELTLFHTIVKTNELDQLLAENSSLVEAYQQTLAKTVALRNVLLEVHHGKIAASDEDAIEAAYLFHTVTALH